MTPPTGWKEPVQRNWSTLGWASWPLIQYLSTLDYISSIFFLSCQSFHPFQALKLAQPIPFLMREAVWLAHHDVRPAQASELMLPAVEFFTPSAVKRPDLYGQWSGRQQHGAQLSHAKLRVAESQPQQFFAEPRGTTTPGHSLGRGGKTETFGRSFEP